MEGFGRDFGGKLIGFVDGWGEWEGKNLGCLVRVFLLGFFSREIGWIFCRCSWD